MLLLPVLDTFGFLSQLRVRHAAVTALVLAEALD